MADAFLKFVVLVLLVRGVSTLVFLCQSFLWLGRKQTNKEGYKFLHRPKVTILIPVLREQKRIVETLNYFVKHFISQKVSIVVITTQREYDSLFNGLSTNDLVKKFIKSNKLENKITCLNYPDKKGLMAHQLNYVLAKTKLNNNSFIAIYNADSRPHPKTIELFYEQLYNYPSAKIFQQSSVFLKNFDKLSTRSRLVNMFLKSSAILQTRWTFAHEFPRLLRQSVSKSKLYKKLANAHVVGHGLIIQTKVLKKVGGFPTENVTEDLFLGYLLRSKGYSIYPLLSIEIAESPSTINSLWNQKYVWFWGPMKYWGYFKYLIANSKTLKVRNTMPPFVFAIQGLVSALAWLTSGPIVLICLISPFLTSDLKLVLFSYLAIIIYGPLQYFIVYYKYCGRNLMEGVSVSLIGIFAILFNSIPPYFSIISEAKHAITGEPIYKPKTE